MDWPRLSPCPSLRTEPMRRRLAGALRARVRAARALAPMATARAILSLTLTATAYAITAAFMQRVPLSRAGSRRLESAAVRSARISWTKMAMTYATMRKPATEIVLATWTKTETARATTQGRAPAVVKVRDTATVTDRATAAGITACAHARARCL